MARRREGGGGRWEALRAQRDLSLKWYVIETVDEANRLAN